MTKLPSLLTGTIAAEYSDIANSVSMNLRSTNDTCGDGCTAPGIGPKGHEAEGSCPRIPKDHPHNPYKKAFVPTVAGWVEPPASRL